MLTTVSERRGVLQTENTAVFADPAAFSFVFLLTVAGMVRGVQRDATRIRVLPLHLLLFLFPLFLKN